MRKPDDPFHLRLASSIGESLAVVGGLIFALLLGLVPAIMLAVWSVAVFWSDGSSFGNKVAISVFSFLLSALFCFACVYMVLATFSTEKAKRFAKASGHQLARAYDVLPSPIKKAASVIIAAISGVVSWLKRTATTTGQFLSALGWWLLGAGIIGGIAYIAFQSIAALPVSVAVIIGAVIIAAAVRR